MACTDPKTAYEKHAFLARAEDADQKAAESKDQVIRDTWKVIADSYRELARMQFRN